jgi:DNA-binding MarR family transcriptional regulator
MGKSLTRVDYQSLAELRYQIRRFLHFSEQAARSVALEPQQHQLMLALKGLPQSLRPRIGDLAERLQIQHHSAVELVNRLAAAGFVTRSRRGEDRREVLVSLTARGERVLHGLSLHHQNELRLQGPALLRSLRHLVSNGASRTAKQPARRENRRSK